MTTLSPKERAANIMDEACLPIPFYENGVALAIGRSIEQAIREAENAALERAANAAERISTFDWAGGEEWAAGFVDGKNAAAAQIKALRHATIKSASSAE